MSALPQAYPHFASLKDADSLRELVQQLAEGIYIINAQGRILDANPAFLKMLGVGSLKELDAYRAADLLVDPAERQRELELLHQNGSIRNFELRIRRPDGQVRTVIDSAYMCHDSRTGEVLFWGILVDIS